MFFSVSVLSAVGAPNHGQPQCWRKGISVTVHLREYLGGFIIYKYTHYIHINYFSGRQTHQCTCLSCQANIVIWKHRSKLFIILGNVWFAFILEGCCLIKFPLFMCVCMLVCVCMYVYMYVCMYVCMFVYARLPYLF